MSNKPEKFEKDDLSLTGELADAGGVISGRLRENSNHALGVLLTTIEAALGDTKQAEATKAIVRREMFLLMDRNQAAAYEETRVQKRGLTQRISYIDGQDELR